MTTAHRAGWVYILTNPAMPGLVKIGHTARRPERRAAELTAATGVPAPFVVAWAHPVADHEALESIVHSQLARSRARHNREFFRCSVQAARSIIEREAAALLLPWWRAWLHRQLHPRPSSRPRPQGRRAQPQGDLFGFYAVLLGLALAGLVIGFRPVLPIWLPAPLISAAYALEQLHH